MTVAGYEFSDKTTLTVRISAIVGALGITASTAWFIKDLLDTVDKHEETITLMREEISLVRTQIAATERIEERQIHFEAGLTSTQAGVSALNDLVNMHVDLRWNIEMMRIYNSRTEQALKDAGVMVSMPDVDTIRAMILFDRIRPRP